MTLGYILIHYKQICTNPTIIHRNTHTVSIWWLKRNIDTDYTFLRLSAHNFKHSYISLKSISKDSQFNIWEDDLNENRSQSFYSGSGKKCLCFNSFKSWLISWMFLRTKLEATLSTIKSLKYGPKIDDLKH